MSGGGDPGDVSLQQQIMSYDVVVNLHDHQTYRFFDDRLTTYCIPQIYVAGKKAEIYSTYYGSSRLVTGMTRGAKSAFI